MEVAGAAMIRQQIFSRIGYGSATASQSESQIASADDGMGWQLTVTQAKSQILLRPLY